MHGETRTRRARGAETSPTHGEPAQAPGARGAERDTGVPGGLAADADAHGRARLMAAALELFNRKGYAATTVRELVAAAGVTKPVLYYHFGNKEGIYRAILEQALAEFEAHLAQQAAATGSVEARIASLLGGVYDLFLQHIPVVRLVHAVFYGPAEGAPPFDFEAFHRVYFAALRTLVAEGVARGELREVSVDDATLLLQAVAAVCMDMELAGMPSRPGRAGLVRMLELVWAGLRAADGGSREGTR